MTFPKISINWQHIAKVFLFTLALVLFFVSLGSFYLLGFVQGYGLRDKDSEQNFSVFPSPTLTDSPLPTKSEIQKAIAYPVADWGGPDLWAEVNKRRQELGVNSLTQRDELCTIASIRLNELLELGKLDGHQGFSTMQESRPDLRWIFEKYSTIAEFLAVGGRTSEETVSLWENTLGHKKLLTGGEYVWGCIYAQDTFAVAITAF